MSMLERLSIRGIRNFGIDIVDEQKIVFTPPLTLILGKNGCGKTTIIECIKYALTGEMPPNCRDGKTFINNPEVLNVHESLGQVKLRVKNLRGNTVTISRSAKVLRKNDKTQFKTLDATISLSDGNERNDVTTSKRNEDATNDMCTAIGTSKAIISHVLFCHQEDSDWPLRADKEVMDIFDKIFGTTEYNNALDEIRLMRKKYDAEIINGKATLRELEMNKEQADHKHWEISKQNDEMKLLEETYKRCDEDLEPIKEKFKRIQKIEDQLSSISTAKAKAETELKNEQQNAVRLREKLKNLFQGDETELKMEIDRFKGDYSTKQQQLAERTNKKKQANNTLSRITSRMEETDREYQKVIHEASREQDLYEERASYIKKLCGRLEVVPDFNVSNCNEHATALIPDIDEKMAARRAAGTEMEENHKSIEFALDTQYAEHREEEIRLTSEIDSLDKQIKLLEADLAQQQKSASTAENNRKLLYDVQRRICRLKEAKTQFETNYNKDEHQNEIELLDVQQTKLDDELDSLTEQIMMFNTYSSIQHDVTSKEKHVEQRTSEASRLKNKHREKLIRLFGADGYGESNFRKRVEALNQSLQAKVNRLYAVVCERGNDKTKSQANLHSTKKDLKKAEDEIRRLDDEIEAACESSPFAVVLSNAKENVKKLQIEHSSLKSSENYYTRYIDNIKDQPCCPLCNRDMNSKEVADLSTELSLKIYLLPEEISTAERKLRTENNKLETLLGLQSHVTQLDELRSIELPKFKTKLGNIEASLTIIQEELRKLEEEIEEPKEKIAIILTLIGDMSILDDAIKDIERTQKDLTTLRSTLPENPNDMNIESLHSQCTAKREENKQLKDSIKLKKSKLNEFIEKMRKVLEAETQAATEELRLKGLLQDFEAIKNRGRELEEKILGVDSDIEKVRTKLNPIRIQLQTLQRKRNETKESHTRKMNAFKKQFDQIERDYDNMERVSNDLKKLAQMNLDKEIIRLKQQLEEIRNERTNQEDIIDAFADNIKNLEKAINEHSNNLRDLNDNLDLKKIQTRIIDKEKELSDLNKCENEVDFEQVVEKKATIQVEMNNLYTERVRVGGQMKEKSKQIESIRDELKQPKYKDSVRNYKKALYESVVLSKIVKDLETYASALEKALTKFHADKMDKINRQIRDLWRNIYKGNDIDYIQINTEETKGSVKKRSYTYRVVASKNDRFMDFRGRSSAGQRVLACLIIRIALAETFSGNCGVLALDEPTTNLDSMNILSLCEALNRLVEEREAQSNFLLLVITHDDNFINSMTSIRSYWHVTRDENGKSKLEKLRVARA